MMDIHLKPYFTEDLSLDSLDYTVPYMPLRDAVYQTLKKAILDGRLKPGQLLIEHKIAEKLSVSRTPVREAIRVLETANLVTFLPGRKFIVSIPTAQDIKEIYDIRLMIETEALRRMTANHQELIQRMEEYVQQAEAYRKQGDLHKMAEMNICFHLTIISAVENQKVQQFISSLHEQISRMLFHSIEWASLREEEHKKIVSLLKIGDTNKAISVLQEHLTSGRDKLIHLFSQASHT